MELAALCSAFHRNAHIPVLTHDKNKMPAKQGQNQSGVKYKTHSYLPAAWGSELQHEAVSPDGALALVTLPSPTRDSVVWLA